MLSLRRAISLAGLDKSDDAPWAGGPRRQIDWALGLGAAALQLDVTLAGIRPRELDQSARRDLAAVLRRSGACCSGLDLWIPEAHFTNAAHQSRAVDAIEASADLAADLRRLGAIEGFPSVSIRTHSLTPKHLTERIGLRADHLGVKIADHRWPREAETLAVGIDPASLLMTGEDPAKITAKLVEPPAVARLSDTSAIGRCLPGKGQLRIDEYEAALAVAKFTGWLVIDLRGLPEQALVARELLPE